MSEPTPGIDELREHTLQLETLLENPHPGLSSWREAVSHFCLAIGDYGGIGMVSAMPDLLKACKATVRAYASHQLYDKCPLNLIEAAIAKAEPKGERR